MIDSISINEGLSDEILENLNFREEYRDIYIRDDDGNIRIENKLCQVAEINLNK